MTWSVTRSDGRVICWTMDRGVAERIAESQTRAGVACKVTPVDPIARHWERVDGKR